MCYQQHKRPLLEFRLDIEKNIILIGLQFVPPFLQIKVILQLHRRNETIGIR